MLNVKYVHSTSQPMPSRREKIAQLTNITDLYATLYRIPMESRSNRPPETLHHLPHLRTTKELLPVLHARSFLRPTYNHPRCCP